MADLSHAPALAGVQRVTLPVSEMARSVHWYATRLGYRACAQLVDGGRPTAVRMRHPDGGPELALRLEPERAAAAAGFDSFVIGVPDRRAIELLAERLSALGERHGGVHLAASGWMLPLLHDPDGREVRFCTVTRAIPGPGSRRHRRIGARATEPGIALRG